MLEELFGIHRKVIKNTPLKFKRYLYNLIDFNLNHICVFGDRGVGKTTLLLQYCIEKYNGNPENCLYISADNIKVVTNTLYNTAEEFFKYGGKALIIDEVHKYPNWSQEVKNIVDIYKDKKILISGSSAYSLNMGKYDLSRRLVYYELKGLSFREFLGIETKQTYKKYSLKEVLKNHVKYTSEISSQITILKYFREYLKYGYYPFYLEGKSVVFNKVNSVVEKILFEDIGTIFNVKQTHIPVLKKIIGLIVTSDSFIPNIDKMSRDLNTSKEYIYNYLNYLEETGLIMSLREKIKGYKLARKPAKLYMQNTNLIYAITGALKYGYSHGSIRETFFLNQIRNSDLKINLHSNADFIVEDKFVIEVGGASKNQKQIKDIRNAYLANDNIEVGIENKIPLYLFGFLY